MRLNKQELQAMLKNNQKIPEGWSVKKISDLGTTVSGGTPDTNNPEYWDGDVLWVTPSEVSALSNRFIWDTERKITEKGLKQSSAKLLPVNSLIICTRATIGDCCINKKPICTNQGFKNIIVTGNNVDFLYYLISKNKHELIRKACGSTFLEISKKDIDNLKFPIPPLHEQEKIAEILGTWDEAIEKLTSLIEQKKLLKKGLMQKLLTGKVRLPGFTQPWKEVKLGEIGTISSAGVDKKIVEGEDLVELLNYMDVYKKDFLYKTDTSMTVSAPMRQIKNCNLRKGDIFFTPSSETPDDIAHSAVVMEDIPNGVYSYHIIRLRPTTLIDLKFSAYAFKTAKFYKQAYAWCEGSGQRYVISQDDFRNMKIYIPSNISEQHAIAEVLSTADDEINLLNQKLEATKEQKKGLMQQLLTGQVRVKVN